MPNRRSAYPPRPRRSARRLPPVTKRGGSRRHLGKTSPEGVGQRLAAEDGRVRKSGPRLGAPGQPKVAPFACDRAQLDRGSSRRNKSFGLGDPPTVVEIVTVRIRRRWSGGYAHGQASGGTACCENSQHPLRTPFTSAEPPVCVQRCTASMTKQPTPIFAGPIPDHDHAPRQEADKHSRRSTRAYDSRLASLVRGLLVDGRRAASDSQMTRRR
jgi:hypothetical protein